MTTHEHHPMTKWPARLAKIVSGAFFVGLVTWYMIYPQRVKQADDLKPGCCEHFTVSNHGTCDCVGSCWCKRRQAKGMPGCRGCEAKE